MVRCAVCGVESPDRFRFCGGCGAPLLTAAPRAREVRKTVSVLFADVAGSTQLGERQDPEATRALMTRYFGAMKAIIEQHGGTVEKFIGDAVMAVFGIPVLHEDDALRAVRAAGEIQATLDRLNAELEAERGISIRIRIGVNTGEVVAGDPSTGQTFVTGDTVNTAARLEVAAPPGATLIGALTWRLVRGAVEAEAVEPLALKGKAEPVPAWRVTSVEPRGRRGMRSLETPLIGRGTELRRLRSAWDAVVADGDTRLITLLGPAGIGKTRLAAELGASVVGGGGRILRGRCLPYGDGATFWPLRELVAGATGAAVDDPPDALRARIEAVLSGQPDAARTAHLVADAIGTSADGVARADLFAGVRQFLAALATAGPLLVIWDDLQWAESALLELVESLAERATGLPVLLVAAAREELLETRPAWAGSVAGAVSVPVDPLAAVAADELVAALLGGGHLPPPLQARLVGTAEGNPLFLIETVAMLVENGVIGAADDGWASDPVIADLPIPPTVQALVAARLDQLGSRERTIAETASVIGRSFGDAELAALMGPDGDALPDGLATLARSGILREERRPGTAAGYRFRHLLLRDACYEGLSKDRRATLHERQAAAIVARGDGQAAGLEAIVGAHLERAARFRRDLGAVADEARLARDAGAWLARAGRSALRRHDADAALSLLERSVTLLPADDDGRLGVSLQLAEARRQSGDVRGCRSLLDETAQAAAAAGRTEIEARARVLLAWLDGGVAEVDRSTAAREAGDDETLSLVSGLRLDHAVEHGRLAEAADAARAVLRHAAACGDPWLVARRARSVLADVAVIDATPVPEAIARCLAMLEDAGHDRRLEAGLHGAIARLEAMRGNLAAARRSAADARDLAADLGLYPGLFAAEATAEVAGASGDWLGAAGILRGAISAAQGAGDERAAARLDVARAAALLRGGLQDEAAAILDRSSDVSLGVEGRLRAKGVRAVLAALAGDAAAARVEAEACRSIADETDAVVLRAEAAEWSGRALATIGEPAGGELLQAAASAYEAKGATHLAQRASLGAAGEPDVREPMGPRRIEVVAGVPIAALLAEAGLSGPRPVLLLVGGADGLSDAQLARAGALLEKVLPPLAEQLDAVVVDGGSDAGVIRAVGLAWRASGAAQPLVGVMARGTLMVSAAEAHRAGSATASPELNHTHLVVVPGERWGDERPWLLAVAATIADGAPRAMLVVNGGPLARREALEAAVSGVPVLVLRGSGRVADELADAVDRGEVVAGPDGPDVASRIRIVTDDPAALAERLRAVLAVAIERVARA